MSTVAELLTNIGYNMFRGTITPTSDPPEAQYIAMINETIDTIVKVLAENNSDIGRTTGSITCSESAITAITAADPGSVTSASHGFSTGDVITISGVLGMTEVNDRDFIVTVSSADVYTIGIATTDYTAYSSGGYGYKAVYSDFASTLYTVAVLSDDDGNEFSGWIEKTDSRPTLQLVTEAKVQEYQPGQADEPECFFLTGDNNVVFLPTPDDSYTIKIPYYPLQTVTATTDTVPFKNLFDNLIIQTITARMQYRIGNLERAPTEWDWFKFVSDRVLRTILLRRRQQVRVI